MREASFRAVSRDDRETKVRSHPSFVKAPFFRPRSFCPLPLLSLCLAVVLAAQQTDPAADPTKDAPPAELSETPAVVSRTAHTREWQWVERLVDETGTTNEVLHGFTEIGTGAC